ncbi:hypothetical protein [Sulfuracidifex tepidarius]|uniref:hypothetical protein n=1 Tax=Sulfuracidifex tepidarius TaxID=1294262 RepID=UPI000A72942B
MKVGIAYDLPRWEEKNIIQEAKNEGHQVIPFYSKQGIFYSDSNIDIEADLFIQRNVSHSRAVMTSFLIESQGIPIVNDYVTLIKSENKAFTTFILSRADIKTLELQSVWKRICSFVGLYIRISSRNKTDRRKLGQNDSEGTR